MIIRTDTKVEDQGDEVLIYWRKDLDTQVRLDLNKDPKNVVDKLEKFISEIAVKEARLIPPTLPKPP